MTNENLAINNKKELKKFEKHIIPMNVKHISLDAKIVFL